MPATVFAGSSLDDNPYQPTLQQQYQDCKAAIGKADKGDIQGFYDSRCGTAASATLVTSYFALHHITALPINATEQQKHDLKVQENTIKDIGMRFCAYKQFNKTELPEVQIAKWFVNDTENWSADIPFEEVKNVRAPSFMMSSLGRNCKRDAS